MTHEVPQPLTAAVLGAGDEAAAWLRALRSCDGVAAARLGSPADDPAQAIADDESQAVVLAGHLREAGALVKRAILARKHVLLTQMTVDSRQLLDLEDLARRRGRVLLVDASGLADDAMHVARRLTRPDHELRRARYLRAVRSDPQGDVDAAAAEMLSRILALARELPSHVTALEPGQQPDAAGPAGDRALYAHCLLRFPSGLVASLDVTTLEPRPQDELVAVSVGRALTLDRLDAAMPLRVLSALRQGGGDKLAAYFGARAEWQAEAARPRRERVAEAFADAARAGDPLSNAREAAGAALVWETARASLARGGEPVALPVRHPLSATPRPNLHVIRGGGRAVAQDEQAPPRLRIVHGSRAVGPAAPPPRSA